MELIRRCERCRQLIEPSYPCFNCGHYTDVAKEEDSKLATTYRHCGLCERVTAWLPDGRCCGCAERANADLPTWAPEARREASGILDPYAWALAKAKLEAEAPATVEDTRLTGGPLSGRDLGDEWQPAYSADLAGDWAPAYVNAWGEPINARTEDGGSRAYRALLDQMWALHIAKNTGYAGHSPDPWANFRQCELAGISAADGVLTRMSDKWSRVCSLWRNPERDCVGESIKDTLVDLSAYALILVCLLEEAE